MSMEQQLFEGTEPRVFSVQSSSENNGRVFVWAKTRWYEREEGETGAVEFAPVADSETELRQWLFQTEPGELIELDDDYAAQIREEFLEQTPLYPEAPELSEPSS
ncbi:MAG TPA: hypothetical protein VNL15_00975 [Dehalococcoidia bacterium]|nr:hypothetical protein [Dehalococcoidia bacterium]